MSDSMDKAWNDLYAQPYNTDQQQDHTDPNAPPPQNADAMGQPKLDRSQTAAKVEKEAGNEQSPALGDYLWDAGAGVAAGAEGFVKSIGKLANDMSGALGMKFADDSAFENSIHTKTWVGGLTSGLTQFALAFLPAVGLVGRVGEAVGITSKLAQSLSAGAVADFFGFTEKQQRLSNLIEEVPALKNPITDFLASKPDDDAATGRLKNALEGLGMGLIMHPLMEGLKGFKGLMAAKIAGDPEAAKAVMAKASPAVADAINRAKAANVAGAVEGAVEEGKANSTVAKSAAEYAKSGVPQELTDAVVKHITESDKPFDVALKEGIQTHLNFDRIVTPKDVQGLHKLALNLSEAYFQKISQGKLNLQVVHDTADELAEVFGENPKLMMASVGSDETAIKNMGVRLVSYRIMRNAIGSSLVNAAERYTGQGSADELARIGTLSKAYMDLHNSVQFIQKEGARIPSFGRIEADGIVNNYDPDKLAQVLEKITTGNGGQIAQKQLVSTILATQADPKSMVNLMDNLISKGGSKAMGVINELHTNAILCSIPTMATKFLSDAMNAVVLPMERIMGGAWQQNKAVMQSGGRTFVNVMQHLMDWTHVFEGATKVPDNVGSSLGSAFKAFVKGSPIIDHLSEFEPQRAISPENLGLKDGSFLANAVKYAGNVVSVPQRMLVSMDQFWKSVNYKGYVRDEGLRLAEQAGLQGDEAARFVNDHITKAFGPNGEALNEAALNYAKSATFSDDLLGGLGKWAQDGVNDHPLLRMVMPFVKTPTNIFRRAWQMTPGLNLLQGQYRKMAMSADPMIRAQAYGRATLGGMMWTLGIGMAATGKLTGGGPSNPEERNALLESGWQPYSLKIMGDDGKPSYISFKRMEPFAYMLGLAADWHEAIGQLHDDDAEKMGTAMAYALAHNLSSKTYLTGLTELVNALAQPDQKVQHFVNNMAGSFVPSQLGKQDDYMHEARTMMDAVRRRIPGLASDLAPNRDLFGQPVRTPGGYLPFGAAGTGLARNVSPFAYSEGVDDNVKQELANLQYGFKKAPQRFQGFDLSQFRNPQTGQDAYDRFQELHGQVQIGDKTMAQSLSDLIKSQRYQSMPRPDMHGQDTNERVRAVNSIIAAYRGRAMAQTLQEYPNIGKAISLFNQQNRGPATPSPVLSALATR